MAVIVQKSWGIEKIIHNSDAEGERYCMKLLVYTRECASSLHFHKVKHETFFVAHGVFELEAGTGPDRTVRTLSTGDTVIFSPGTIHRVRCKKVGTIVEASTFDNPADCVRLEASE